MRLIGKRLLDATPWISAQNSVVTQANCCVRSELLTGWRLGCPHFLGRGKRYG
jgi:hypothetical protein